MSDKLGDMRKLVARVGAEAKKMNLVIADIAFRPAFEEEGRDTISVVFILTPEAVETAEETTQRKTDQDFEALFAANFGDTVDFADDETQKIVADWEGKQSEAKDALAEMLAEMEEDDDGPVS